MNETGEKRGFFSVFKKELVEDLIARELKTKSLSIHGVGSCEGSDFITQTISLIHFTTSIKVQDDQNAFIL